MPPQKLGGTPFFRRFFKNIPAFAGNVPAFLIKNLLLPTILGTLDTILRNFCSENPSVRSCQTSQASTPPWVGYLPNSKRMRNVGNCGSWLGSGIKLFYAIKLSRMVSILIRFPCNSSNFYERNIFMTRK